MTARRLRIVFFGTGGLLSTAALRAIAGDHDVLAVVRAQRGGHARRFAARLARRLGLRAGDPLTSAARTCGLREWPVASVGDDAFAERLTMARPDLLCVAHFPWRLPEPVLGAATLGGVNLHPSLLPRHRGPLPLFWIYHADDRETGVTVHHMTRTLDTGDIVAQRSFPLARGYPADDLNATNAQAGAELLKESVRALARGEAARRPQDAALATRAPFVQRGVAMVDYDAWDVERTWHFLAGVWPRFIEPISDAHGQPQSYAGVIGYDRGLMGGPLGRTRPLATDRLALQCRNGIVVLRSAAPTRR